MYIISYIIYIKVMDLLYSLFHNLITTAEVIQR